MKRAYFGWIVASGLLCTLGSGCPGNTQSSPPPKPQKDLVIVWNDDADTPPGEDAGPGDPNACGDFDQACQEIGLGPDNNKPWPLSGDPMKDPSVFSDGLGRSQQGWLVLDQTRAANYFIWIANAGEDSVSKIDSRTLREIARYPSYTCFSSPKGSKQACDGNGNGCCAADSDPQWQNRRQKKAEGPPQQVQQQDNSPSRTAVDFNGDLFVANRAFGGQPSVTKISNDLATCKDRNKNGKIDTSTDIDADGLIDRDCNQNGIPDDIDDVKGAPCMNNMKQEYYGLDDECVLWTANHNVVNGTGRPLGLGPGAIDNGPADAWAGGFENGIFVRLDGTTGKAKDQWQLPQDCQPYGLAIDSQGYGWSPNLGAGPLCYFDTRNNQNVGKVRDPQFGQMEGYGITLDRDQNVWVGFSVHRYTPDRTNGFKNLGNGWWTKFNMNGVGIAADSRTPKKYFVWSADGGSNVTRIPASDIPVVKMDQQINPANWPVINTAGAYGVGIDADQHVVSVDSNNVTRTKIDMNGDFMQPDINSPPKGNNKCPAGDRCELNAGAYTYSDFTGFGLRNFTRPQGTYTYVFKGCEDMNQGNSRTDWYAVRFDSDVPPNTTLSLRVRSGSTVTPDMSWGAWTPATTVSPLDLQAGKILIPNGPDQDTAYYLQIEFTLKTNDRTTTPKLKNVNVAFKCNHIG